MKVIAAPNPIIRQLADMGVIPRLCTKFVITVDTREVVRIETTTLCTEEQFQQLIQVLRDNPEAAKELGRRYQFENRDLPGDTVTV